MKRLDRSRLVAMTLCGCLLSVGCEKSVAELPENFRPQQVVPPFPPIVDFPVVSAGQAGESPSDHELVLGVTIGQQSRAYPINMLTGPNREILNDRLGGRAIAATW